MAVTLVATAGAANANSFATLAEANNYHERRLHIDDWEDADGDVEKETALIWATRLISSAFEWVGWPTSQTQALPFPMSGLTSRLQNTYVQYDVVPQEIKDATAELARLLIAEDRTLDSDVETQGVKSMRVGPVAFEFRDNVAAKVIADSVIALIPRWWYTRGPRSKGVRNLARG